MIKEFFRFSPKDKRVKIYFSDIKDLDTELFKSLSFKTLPREYILIKKAIFKKGLFLRKFKEPLEVPNNNVFITYKGYDSTVYFSREDKEIEVIREKNGEYFAEEFLGYPIHYDFCNEKIGNKEILKKVLKNHWEGLKTGKEKIHGDFTHNNILVNSKGEINIIDSKETNSNTPIVRDHFYFYSYFLIRANKECIFKRKNYINEIQEIYKDVFNQKDKETILRSIEELDQDDFPTSRDKQVFEFWKNNFYQFMEKII